MEWRLRNEKGGNFGGVMALESGLEVFLEIQFHTFYTAELKYFPHTSVAIIDTLFSFSHN